jgi:hypothetical protein
MIKITEVRKNAIVEEANYTFVSSRTLEPTFPVQASLTDKPTQPEFTLDDFQRSLEKASRRVSEPES